MEKEKVYEKLKEVEEIINRKVDSANAFDDDFGYSTLSLKYEYMLEEFNKFKKELKLENDDDINKALEYLDDFSKKLD